MRTRLWNELLQVKYNAYYCVHLLAHRKQVLNFFNIVILAFSTGGIMGWKLWENTPVVSCAIIYMISLLKLLQVHLIPSEKDIEKLDKVSDFYFEQYNKLESLWYMQERITEQQLQEEYYKIKESEIEANKILKDVLKRINNKVHKTAKERTNQYFELNFKH